jgi:hypothetical protein
MITSLIRAILWGFVNILFWIVIAILFSLMICTLFIGYTLEKIGNFIDWVFENDEKKSSS